MARLTITLSDEIHRALKQASAERNRTIGELVEESLESYGIRSREEAAAIVARVRAASTLGDDEALQLRVVQAACLVCWPGSLPGQLGVCRGPASLADGLDYYDRARG